MSQVSVVIRQRAPVVIRTGENTVAAAASALSAQESAASATASAATAQALVGPTYASTAAGIAATSSGDFFAVNDAGTVTIYLNSAGTPVEQRDFFTLDADLGTLPSGSVDAIDISRTAIGAADGGSQFYSLVNRVYAQGSNSMTNVRAQYSGCHVDTTGGAIDLADSIHAYVWKTGAGTVANAHGVASHIRSDGGAISVEAINYRCISTTLGGGATINTIKGFSSGQLGGSGVGNVITLDVEDTTATTLVIGLRGSITAGTNKYNIFCGGDAQSAHLGNFGLGITSAPLWKLVVREPGNTLIANFENSGASPFGIRVDYTGTAPDSSDNAFITCRDTASIKFAVLANGAVHVRGSQVVSSRKTGWSAPTGTATRTSFATGSVTTSQLAERVKALIDDLTAHGLTGP